MSVVCRNERIANPMLIRDIVFNKSFIKEVKKIEEPETSAVVFSADIAHAINMVFTGAAVCRPINYLIEWGDKKVYPDEKVIIDFNHEYWNVTDAKVYGVDGTAVFNTVTIIPPPNLDKCREIADYILNVYRENLGKEEEKEKKNK